MEMTDEIRQELRKHMRKITTAFNPIDYCEPDGVRHIKAYFVAKVERLQDNAVIDELVRFLNDQKLAYPVSEMLLIDQDFVLDILDKRVPKHPIGYPGYTCPSCLKPIYYYYRHVSFCPECGQALAWEYKNELEETKLKRYLR